MRTAHWSRAGCGCCRGTCGGGSGRGRNVSPRSWRRSPRSTPTSSPAGGVGRRRRRRRQAALVGERLGFHHVYVVPRDLDAVHSGNAIVSRWPILRTSWRPLPAGGAPDERRTVLFADIDGPRGALQVFCTHLNWRFDHSEVRQDQVRLIGAFVDECRPRDYPPILSGDMNAAPDSDEIRILTGRTAVAVPKLVFHDAWEVAGDGCWDDVVERQPVCGARPRAGAPHRLRVRGLAQGRRPRPCGASGSDRPRRGRRRGARPTTTASSRSCATDRAGSRRSARGCAPEAGAAR